MSWTYIVGRGSTADLQTPKAHDAVGKLHLRLEDAGAGQVRLTDLQSTNGTFLRVGKKWEEIHGVRVVSLDADIMLGDYETTPRRLMAGLPAARTSEVDGLKKYRSAKEEKTPPPLPLKKRTGPRRNEFGEIVHE